MKQSAWFYVLKKIQQMGRNIIWVVEYRLSSFILVLLLVCIPVFVTVLQETVTLKPPQPAGDCVSIVAADSSPEGRRLLCFVADFSAQWYRNLVEFPTTITADCQVMGDQGEKKACENRKELGIDHLAENMVWGMIGFVAGSQRR